MRWLKRDRWKAGIAIAGMLLLLVLMVWVPVSVVGAYEGASGLATPITGTVQVTPTEDATVTALNKEKLVQEVQQLKNQNEPDPLGWLRTNAAVLLSTLVVVVGALFGFWRWRVDRRDAQDKELKDRQAERERREEEQKRWLEDRQAEREKRDEEQQRWLKDQEAEREKRAEERFQSAVTGLGDEKEGAKIGAAILLRTFLGPGYEQFYTQTFDLAVTHLRLRNIDPNTPEPLDTLSQALITVFKEAFPLARDRLKEENSQFSPQSLSASRIQLDNAYLREVDLIQAWMRQASLREASLFRANFSKAHLTEANFSGADLNRANFSEAYLREANFSRANLRDADFSKAYLSKTDFSKANPSGVSVTNFRGGNFSGADLSRANFSEAYLREANFSKANLSGADLSGTNLEGAILQDTDLRGVIRLTKEQLKRCKAQGAIIDEDSTTGSFQAPVSPLLSSQSNDAQAPSVPLAQGSPPISETDGNSANSSKSSNNGQAPSALPNQESTTTPGTDESSATSSQPSSQV